MSGVLEGEIAAVCVSQLGESPRQYRWGQYGGLPSCLGKRSFFGQASIVTQTLTSQDQTCKPKKP